MNQKRIMGLLNAPKEKRYRSFISSSCDTEEVWIAQCGTTISPFENEVTVWPAREFVELFVNEGHPVVIDVHDFMEELSTIKNPNCIVHVFPNGKDSYDVSIKKLLADIQDELALIE